MIEYQKFGNEVDKNEQRQIFRFIGDYARLDAQFNQQFPNKKKWEVRRDDDKEIPPTATEIENLVDGSLHLLNFLLNASEKSESFDTIVALDKSARTSIYFFSVLLRVLQSQGKLPNNFKKPDITFLNVGMTDETKDYLDVVGGKTNDPVAAKKLEDKYKKKYLENKKILVVDEYAKGATSIRKSMTFLRTLGTGDVVGIQQLQHYGYWWKDANLTDVEDPEISVHTWEFVRSRMNDDDTFLYLVEELVAELRTADDLKNTAEIIDRILYDEDYSPVKLSNTIKTFIEYCKSKGYTNFDVLGVFAYIKTNGGLRVLNKRKDRKKNGDSADSIQHRDYLKNLAKIVANNISN